MKKYYDLVLLAFLLTACQRTEEVSVSKESIRGSYVCRAQSEYSKAMDTLTVTPYDLNAGTFIIIRKTGFQKIIQGKLQPKQYKQEKMIGVWDEETRQLQDIKKGRIYTFPSGGEEILAGTDRYIRIK